VRALKVKGLSDAQIGIHAGSADTSLTMALACCERHCNKPAEWRKAFHAVRLRPYKALHERRDVRVVGPQLV
jgi:hypothetical protein